MDIALKFKKLHERAIVPEYKTDGSVGFDFYSIDNFTLETQGRTIARTGLAVEIPPGYEMTVRQRSGLSLQYPNYITIGIGTVDWDYRGEIVVPMFNHEPFHLLTVKIGDRIAQGIISPVVRPNILLVEELSETKRGEGGFGSTGK